MNKPSPDIKRQVLEKELERFHQVSIKIDELTSRIYSQDQASHSSHQLLEEYLDEQSSIIDQFIDLSTDWDSLKRFAIIVKDIQLIANELDNSQSSDDYDKNRNKVISLIDQWAECLETIITGVLCNIKD